MLADFLNFNAQSGVFEIKDNAVTINYLRNKNCNTHCGSLEIITHTCHLFAFWDSLNNKDITEAQ